MPTEKVEIGFDQVLPSGPFFTLDDPTKGQLDNVDYTLAGFAYYDVTSYVKEILLARGKNNNLDAISAADFVVSLDNRTRAFDPEYADSPFYGNILPRRKVRYSIDSELVPASVVTNLITNPNFETNIANYTVSAATLIKSSDWSQSGNFSLKITPTGSSSASYSFGYLANNSLPVLPNTTYTLSGYFYQSQIQTGTLSSNARRIQVTKRNGGSSTAGPVFSAQATNTIGVQRLSVTFTTEATTNNIYFLLYNGSTSTPCYWDSIILTQGSTIEPYFDGSSVNDDEWTSYSWSGTANASTSSRTIEEHYTGRQFTGVIDDWNFVYTPNGDAIASFVASDGFVYLNNQTLSAGTATPQLSGARINTILDNEFVQWPSDNRDIDAGVATLGADVIPDDQNVLAYLQTVERSEQGLFFISKTGVATFRDRRDVSTSENIITFSNNGSGIAYQDLLIGYGSEDLANEAVVSSDVTATTVTASDEVSQSEYGIFNTTLTGLLNNSTDDLISIAGLLIKKYSQPVYRFDQLTVRLNSLTTAQVADVVGLELGDTVLVSFTPSNIPPAIEKYATVIRINHSVDVSGEHLVTLGLATQNFTYLILDDLAFGRLDEGALSF